MVGLAAEARIAAQWGWPVRTGGGTPEGATAAALCLVADGATGLISFGLAGGLDPALRPGAVVIPHSILNNGQRFTTNPALATLFGGLTDHTLLAGLAIAASATDKRALFMATGACAIDLESGGVAEVAKRHGMPFAVVRAICDPAERDLPPAALIALDAAGVIGISRVLRSLSARPGQVPALLALARDAALARRALTALRHDDRPAGLFGRVQTAVSRSSR